MTTCLPLDLLAAAAAAVIVDEDVVVCCKYTFVIQNDGFN